MARQWKRMHALWDLLGGQVTKRVILVKGIVTFTLVAWWLNPELATPVAVLGNMIWLWVAPENETEFVRSEIAKAVVELRSELDDVRKIADPNGGAKKAA